MRANVDNLFQEAKMNNIRHKFQQICLFAYKDGKEKLIWKSQLLEKKITCTNQIEKSKVCKNYWSYFSWKIWKFKGMIQRASNL